jgi:GDP-L-fucose synthase
LYLLEHYDGSDHVNVGTGTDLTIREVAATVASVVGFCGETSWDTTKPDGTVQKLLDVSKLAQLGWTSKIGLEAGLERTVAWYRDHVGAMRG